MVEFQYNEKHKIVVTCALPYVNNIPHVGNIVGSHLPGDIFARYLKLRKLNVIYIGGSDEHGTPTTVTAQKLGITPQQLTNKLYEVHKQIYNWLNIGYDNFSRTSKKIHHKTTQQFYKKIEQNGYVKEKTIKLPYCETCKRTLPDRYVEGQCPHCKAEKARGDQCDNCTKLLDPQQLIKPYCTICGKTPTFKNQKHLFLDLKKLEPKIKKWIENQKHWNHQTTSEALGWIKEGLKERSITRDLNWGVKVNKKGYENKVFYVWFDAPIGYISSTKEKTKKWEEYWKQENGKIIHFIGKDNIPFHTIWWGGMLIANGEYNLPYNVVGLQYCNYEGKKISKSKQWGVFCENLPKTPLPPDSWRYYFTHLIPENKDTEFKWKEFQNKNNAELVGTIGNLYHRILTFAHSKLGGVIKTPTKNLTKKDEQILNIAKDYEEILIQVENVKLRETLKTLLKKYSQINKYLQNTKFWEKNKEEQQKIIGVAGTAAKDLAILLWPYLPTTTEKILKTFNTKPEIMNIGKPINTRITKKPKPLFPTINDEQLKKIKETVTKTTPLENLFNKQTITYEEFKKLEIKTGTITKVEEIKGSDKLYKLIVDTGEERTIVSGIKKEYTKKELIGKQIIVLTNLEPKTIRGVKSEGMLLAVENKDGTATLITPEKRTENGLRIT